MNFLNLMDDKMETKCRFILRNSKTSEFYGWFPYSFSMLHIYYDLLHIWCIC